MLLDVREVGIAGAVHRSRTGPSDDEGGHHPLEDALPPQVPTAVCRSALSAKYR